MPIHVIVTLLIFYFSRMYHSLWKFVGVHEIGYLLIGNGLSFVAQIIGMSLLHFSMPTGFHFIQVILQALLVSSLRFSYRFLRYLKGVKEQKLSAFNKWKNVMVIGAGEAGKTIIEEIVDSKLLTMKVCCVIDDDQNKLGRYINGIPIVGNRNAIQQNVEKYK